MTWRLVGAMAALLLCKPCLAQGATPAGFVGVWLDAGAVMSRECVMSDAGAAVARKHAATAAAVAIVRWREGAALSGSERLQANGVRSTLQEHIEEQVMGRVGALSVVDETETTTQGGVVWCVTVREQVVKQQGAAQQRRG